MARPTACDHYIALLLRGDQYQKNDQQKNDDWKRDAFALIQMRTARALVFTLGCGDHRLDTRCHRLLTIAGSQTRNNDILDDLLATRIRQRAFKTIANFDPQFAIIGKEEQNRAVVLTLLPWFPRLKNPLREVQHFTRFRHRSKNRHQQLRRGFALVFLQALVDRSRCRRAQPTRLIVHIVRRRACGHFCTRDRHGKHLAEAGEPKAKDSPACMARQCHFASPD